jgi:hypothetical protein
MNATAEQDDQELGEGAGFRTDKDTGSDFVRVLQVRLFPSSLNHPLSRRRIAD